MAQGKVPFGLLLVLLIWSVQILHASTQPLSSKAFAEKQAGNNSNATLQGRWAKGPTYAVASGADNHVYFGNGAELICATVNNAGEVSQIGSLVLPGVPKDIEISDSGFAYVAMGYQGVAVVDIRTASDPQLVSRLTRPDDPFDALALSLSGSHLYIAAGAQGLLLATISNESVLTLNGVYRYNNCQINGVSARNDTVFTASGSKGLEMLHYADGSFTLLKQVNYNQYTQNYQSQTPSASDVVWRHDSLYVADSWTGLFFFTVQNTDLTFSGVALGACSHVLADGIRIYTTDYYNVNAFEISDGKPHFVTSQKVPTSKQMALCQNFILVAGKSHGLYTFKNDASGSLTQKSFFPNASLTYDVFRQGYYLYRVTPINTLDVIAVHNPADPHTSGHLELGGENEEAHHVFVAGDTAFVASYDFKNGEAKLYFIDVQSPSAPALLASWTYPTSGNSFNAITAQGKILFAAVGQDIVAIDFSDLNNIHQVGQVTTSGWTEDMALQGSYLFTAAEDAGMCVIDVSDPANMQQKTTFRESDMDYYVAIRIQDHYAYIGDNWIGLKIVDISQPLSPALAGSFTQADGDFYADHLALAGNYVYTQRAWGEIIFLNISDPANPQLKGAYAVDNVTDLSAYSRMVYIAQTDAGISAVSNDNEDALLPCHFAGEVRGEWTCETIYIEGDVTIPAGDTLRIDQSVKKVAVLGPYQIKVQGVLLAIGPANDHVSLSGDRILFTGNGWHGILFNNLNDTQAGTSLIENCRFDYADKRDITYQGGGAIAIYNSDNVIIRQSVFYRNVARLGGAIYIENANPKIEDCYFEVNGRGGVNLWEQYTDGGGAMYIKNARPYLHRLRFARNGAHSGGAMVIDGCSPTLSNILFEQNISGGLAGAVAVTSDGVHPAAPRFVNVTIADNEASSGGGALQLMGPQTRPEIINSILFGNAKPEIYINDGTPTVTYSIVDSAASESWFGTGCLTDDPLFDETGQIDYHLRSTACGSGLNSPAIDAGHPDSVDTKLDCSAGLGTARADMGYYGGRYAEQITAVESPAPKHYPQAFRLEQNYPNPFNPTTTIRYELPAAAKVRLTVYNTLGQKVAVLVNQKQSAGSHVITFNASRLSSGVYFYRLKVDGRYSATRKMILLR